MIDEIVKTIKSMEGKYSAYDIFEDWVHMLAIAYSQTVMFNEAREQEYKQVEKKYTKQQMEQFGELGAMLVKTYSYMGEGVKFRDALGEIYMSMGLGSKNTGQFFSPYSISEIMANIVDETVIRVTQKAKNGIVKLYEPTVGSGANIIAVCEKLKDEGINYQNTVKVIAQDLDYKAVCMSYVQFTLLGIPAIVVQGDSLTTNIAQYDNAFMPHDNAFVTLMLKMNWDRLNVVNENVVEVEKEEKNNFWESADSLEEGQQMNLMDYIS